MALRTEPLAPQHRETTPATTPRIGSSSQCGGGGPNRIQSIKRRRLSLKGLTTWYLSMQGGGRLQTSYRHTVGFDSPASSCRGTDGGRLNRRPRGPRKPRHSKSD